MNADTRSVFRKLVTNQHIEDFDYINTEFAFKTVYNVSKYTYRCCPCAFEHEYLDYIGNDGEINEEMYDKIVNCIVDGKCPHVTDVNERDILYTGVYGIAIAIVLGTEVIRDEIDLVTDKCCSALFNVHPFMLAIKKSIISLPVTMTEYCYSSKMHMMDTQRSRTNAVDISLDDCDVLKLCIRNKNENTLEVIPARGKDIERTLPLAFKSRSERLINTIMQKIDLTNDKTEWISKECCRLSIIYDRPDVLQTHLGRFSSTFHIVRKDLEHMLTTCCKVLERSLCKEVITKFIKYEEKQILISELVANKLYLLREFYDDVHIREGTLSSLKHNKEESPSSFKKEDFLKIYSRRFDNHEQINNTAFKTMLDAAAVLFPLPQNDISHLDALLEDRFLIDPGSRKVLEILLFENPDFDGNTSLFKKCLTVDKNLKCMRFGNGYVLHTSLIMDCKQHAMFKHDHARDFALNFTAPLLIECGCPYSFDDFTAFTSRYGDGALHKAEIKYLCQIKEFPKNLTNICRDVLRCHFKGERIHRFVKQSNIPQRIKDVILLKDILKYISNDLVY